MRWWRSAWAAHTVNAGRVYFAAGSFEPEDFPDGLVDRQRNMVREVRRGNRPRHRRRCGAAARYYALSTADGTVIFRRYHLDATADEIAGRISDFVGRRGGAGDRGAGDHPLRDDLPDGLMPHMKPLIDGIFRGSAIAPRM